jgi:hypothetical protein
MTEHFSTASIRHSHVGTYLHGSKNLVRMMQSIMVDVLDLLQNFCEMGFDEN